MPRQDKTPKPERLICDFTGGAVRHRFLFGGGRGQALPRAVGMKGGKNPLVADATAGLGGDAFLLASLGAEVIMIERSPDMHRLLEEGLARAGEAGGDVAEVISRMTLLYGDARDLLPTLSPEVVLVDPMHPPRKKTALVKSEMRLIREIVGADEDSVELMKVALATAGNRVVLKWPRLVDPMEGIRLPSHQIAGKSTRYDVFMAG
ncbi:MAG: 16S rRNA methyltransferase [Rhodospirillales bacterium RIFCSPLOWO2_12_FULL_58_28]|nr:MAG: 16S rRNA methyltransferase [Rhodospirillales bacterium RIFCSPLOWO2_02_FULL_58_16]OHC78095.1 MAG: 16S rRNA methyltransferase [Rhodospirillales bacterium RIFCSPLOWO2_12_FULL_58_28]